ncbi:MAG: PASTA domain-containing protein [Candidatus Eisenbacteria bacterium]|uniref:PASTA domain-containing protein n=1 Tax=Eiseniibacteriota bacterium TaxID=2212470 RepID=A0A538SAU3_UNCEI|nr:MAG: PASTA domain-containing protein [Candidatus Eisenbacteria bacterium]
MTLSRPAAPEGTEQKARAARKGARARKSAPPDEGGGEREVSPSQPPEPEPRRPPRWRVGLFTVGLAIAAFTTGLFLFNDMVMPRLIHSSGEVRVPDLGNLTFVQGERALQPLGLKLSRAGERFDPAVPQGFILSQDPPAETPVRGRKRVMVVLSLGEESSSVPNLFGESVRNAQYLLERAGLRVGGSSHAPSEEVGEELVVASDPPAEAVLPRNAPVSLLVSSGAGEETFVMPDLLGREIGGARRQLESLGFHVLTPPAAPSVGTILVQEPAPGSRITRASTILLQASGRIIR